MKVFACFLVCSMRNRNFTVSGAMKDMLLLTCLLSFLIACSSDFKSVKYIGLKGKVKLVADTVYSIGFTRFDSEIRSISLFEMDSSGYCFRETQYNKNGELSSSVETSYTGNGMIARTRVEYHGEREDWMRPSNYCLVKEGKDQWTYITTSEGEQWTDVKTWDGRKRSMVTITEPAAGNREQTSAELQSFYDRDGNTIEERLEMYARDTLLVHQVTRYRYDRNGDIVKVLKIYQGQAYQDTITTECSYLEYDDRGNWRTRATKDNSGSGCIVKRFILYAD